MSLDPIYTWQPTTCGMCGQPIVYVGPYWQHTGEAQPRHPAVPAAEWERIKAQQPATDLSDVTAIRERWADIRWTYGSRDYGSHYAARYLQTHYGDIEISDGEPECDALLLASHAPADIRDLLTALDEAHALLRQCRPWLPAVERELREAVARALEEER